ncbi:MAG: hypothetical protein HY326_13750 [Chloroflexi bacterium]|nr:hypothetical protein [Chloroflexota bacterium]
MSRLLDNLGSAILALILALLVWTVAVNESNPPREGAYPDTGLQLEVVNLDPGLTLFDALDRRVYITLRGPAAGWEGLRSSDFRAFLDLKGVTTGAKVVPVQIQCADCDRRKLYIVSYEPSEVNLRIEEIAEKVVDVQVNVLDTLPLSYTYRRPIAIPNQVKVRGPRSEIDKVTAVVANVFLGNAKETVTRSVTVVPRDTAGNALSRVQTIPPNVEVRVEVEQRAGYKEVSVRAVTTGTLSAGYYMSNIRVDPTTVTLQGNQQALEQLAGFIDTRPINANKIDKSFSQKVELVLPPGVTIQGSTQVTVSIEVAAVVTGQTMRRGYIMRGVNPLLTATVSPPSVDVLLSGPVSLLQNLLPEDVLVILDMSGKDAGIFKIKPSVLVPPSVKVEGTQPAEVEVTLSPSVLFSPTITATLPISPAITPAPTR